MGWIETNGEEPDDVTDCTYIWIAYAGGGIDLVEGWASIDWPGVTHWQEALIDVPFEP